MEFQPTSKLYTKKSAYFFVSVSLVLVCIPALVIGYISVQVLDEPPHAFPVKTDIVIEENLSAQEIVHILKDARVVKSSLYTRFVIAYYFENKYIQAGTYRFDAPRTTYEIVQSVTRGENLSPLVRITLPEGFSTKNLYVYLPHTLSTTTIQDVSALEGYLFPDTYFISGTMTFDDILTLLQNTHTKKMLQFAEQINESSLSEREVIILASILEREANTIESKKMVSGILQNRLAINMPLQADAVFNYILNKTSAELTEDDLKIDSPYNTYIYTGFPPTPISNPGIEAIEAVLNPMQSEYLYYITGDDGNFYYAKTFEDHKRNKAKYIQ